MRERVYSVILTLLLLLNSGGLRAQDTAAFSSLNFDNVDIRTLTKLVGERTGRHFVIAEDVSGKVTIVWPRVPEGEVYSAFVTVLEASGCSVIEEGGVSRVVRLSQGSLAIGPVLGPDAEVPETGMVTKVFRLQHIRAAAFKHMLEAQQVNSKVTIGILDDSNQIVVTDTSASVRRIATLLEQGLAVNLSQQEYSNTNLLLEQVDLLVTDYSSIWVDYLLKQCPVLGFCPDLAEYTRERGFLYRLEQVFPGPLVSTIQALTAELDRLLGSGFQPDDRHLRATQLFHAYSDGGNTERVINAVLEPR